jgi:hypothetical protein
LIVSELSHLISGDIVLTPGRFLLLNVATIATTCLLYGAYLFFLVRKRLRAGAYQALPLGK